MKFVSREKELILLIGQGLSNFGQTEMELGKLFVIALQADNPKAAERVFWSVNSLEVRTAMVGAALKEIWPKVEDGGTLKTEWAGIAARIPRCASKRAELAHGNWVGLAWIGRNGTQKFDQFFAPYYGKASVEIEKDFTKPGFDPRPAKRLYEGDLERRKEEFSSLGMQISSLRAHIRFWLERPDLKKAHEGRRPSRPAHPSATPKKRGK